MSVQLAMVTKTIETENNTHQAVSSARIQWQDLTSDELEKYLKYTDNHLKKVYIDHALILCDDPECKDIKHLSEIDRLYDSITNCLLDSSAELIDKSGHDKPKQIAGWNEYCQDAHANAREAFLIWVSNRKPRLGPICDIMKHTRAVFKLALRQCRSSKSKAHADSLARKLISKNSRRFWNEIKKLNGKADVPLAATVDHASGEEDIAAMWQEHFQKLLNSTPHSQKRQSILDKLEHCSSLDDPITAMEVTEPIKNLKTGKLCGHDMLQIKSPCR